MRDFFIEGEETEACGTPVIAYGKGGVCETVVAADGTNWDEATGFFFGEQTPAALAAAVRQFLAWEGRFRPEVLRRNAERFNRERFKGEIAAFVSSKLGLKLIDLWGPFDVQRSTLWR
ncbi:MAG: glycosyltransferase [Bacillota bacterium]